MSRGGESLFSASHGRWLIYALGGGLGHLTRALSLARQAVRNGRVVVTILSNSPAVRWITDDSAQDDSPRRLLHLGDRIELVTIPSTFDKRGVTEFIENWLTSNSRFDVVVVDTFPRGLAGELAEWIGRIESVRAFVHRDINPEYVRWADLSSAVEHFDVVFLPGERGPLAQVEKAVMTDPWLICGHDELLSRDEARRMLIGEVMAPELPIVVIAGSGKEDEAVQAAQAAVALSSLGRNGFHVRLTAWHRAARVMGGKLSLSIWPLLVVARGIDLLIGAGGYNSVMEARSADIPLIAVPQRRLYDRQAARLSAEERAKDWSDAVERAMRFLTPGHFVSSARRCFPNGAVAAANLLCQLAATRS